MKNIVLILAIILSVNQCDDDNGNSEEQKPNWTRIDKDNPVFGGRYETNDGDVLMNAITTNNTELIVVGQKEEIEVIEGIELRKLLGMIWTSNDGKTWKRYIERENEFSTSASQKILGVTVGGPGAVAVGTASELDDYDAAVWIYSNIYNRWGRIDHDNTVFSSPNNTIMYDVACSGNITVAVGEADGSAAVWYSNDPSCQNWTRVVNNIEIFGNNGSVMNKVVATPLGFIAVGLNMFNNQRKSGIWISDNGINWNVIECYTSQYPITDFIYEGNNVILHSRQPGDLYRRSIPNCVDSKYIILDNYGQNRTITTILNDPEWSNLGGLWAFGYYYNPTKEVAIYNKANREPPTYRFHGTDRPTEIQEQLGGNESGEQAIIDVVEFKNSFIAIGTDRYPGNSCAAAVWRYGIN